MKRKAAFFVAFEKVEKQEDGTMLVSGVASSEAVDADGETITSDAMKAALPDYMKFGAVREMHQPIAAGTAIKCEVDAAGVTHLEAKIVDPTTVMKIEEEVLKGFSVGGKVTSRDPLNKTIITGIRLTEISVVDRPANPEAVFKLAKVDGDEPEGLTLSALRKSMWSIADFASMLQSLAFVAWDSAYEAECEGDASPVPAALGAWIADGLGILQAMTAEECAELLACLPCCPVCNHRPCCCSESPMAMAAKAAGLAKAGAKFSKASKEALADIHKCLKDCDTKMAALGYDSKEDDEEDAAGGSDDTDKVAKAAKQAEDLQKALGQVETLTKRVKELEAQPEPPKGVLNANSIVSKGDDTSNPDSDDAALLKQAEEIASLPPEEQTRFLIKAIHAGAVATR